MTDKPLSWPIMVAWSIGTIGPVTLLYLVSSAYLIFMTDLVGMPGALAGALIFGVRLYDMVADPVMGFVSDRTESRMGRRRPWMLVGAFATVAGCIAIFTVPPSVLAAGGGALAAWVTLALLVYFTGYTMFNVPYMAMSAEMTDSFAERTRLMSLRVVFVSLSSLLGVALAPRLIDRFGNGVASYEITSWVIGAIGLAAMLACVAFTGRARATPRTDEPFSLAGQLQVALSNRPFLILIGTKMLLLLSLSSLTTSLFFFVRHVLHRDLSVASEIGLAQTVGMLACLPLWVRAGRTVTKQHLFMVTSGCNAIVLLSWLLVGPETPDWELVLRAAILGAFSGGSLLMGQSMLPDTMEYDYRRSGERREGAFSGIYSMVEKAGFAFGPLLIGSLLSLAGYTGAPTGTGGAVELSEAASRAVYLGVSVIPAIATGLCVLVLRGYTLTEEQLRSLQPPGAAAVVQPAGYTATPSGS